MPRTGSRIPVVLFILMLCGLAVKAYDALDENGWVYHRRSVDLFMSPEWLDGESRECVANLSTVRHALPYVIQIMRCPANAEIKTAHTLTIGFWGKPDRESLPVLSYSNGDWGGVNVWRCRRSGDTFTCYALN